MTPSARSTQWLRKQGFIVARVEQIVHMPKAPFPFKRDAFGFGDLLVAKLGWGVALVQVTVSGKLNEREAKAKEQPHFAAWIQCGRFLLHGWRKGGARGKRKTWQLTEREVRP